MGHAKPHIPLHSFILRKNTFLQNKAILECLAQFGAPQQKRHVHARGGIQWRATVVIMEHMMCKDRLKEPGLFCLKKLKQGGDFAPVFQLLYGKV